MKEFDEDAILKTAHQTYSAEEHFYLGKNKVGLFSCGFVEGARWQHSQSQSAGLSEAERIAEAAFKFWSKPAEASRCKHDVSGEDCFVCYPTKLSEADAQLLDEVLAEASPTEKIDGTEWYLSRIKALDAEVRGYQELHENNEACINNQYARIKELEAALWEIASTSEYGHARVIARKALGQAKESE